MVNDMGDSGGYSPFATASSCENGGRAGVGGAFVRSNMDEPDFIDGSEGTLNIGLMADFGAASMLGLGVNPCPRPLKAEGE